MADFKETLRRIALDLSSEKCRFALVGGLAVGFWARPRTTKDVDLAVAAASEHEAEQLVLSLQRRGYKLLQLFERESGELSTVRLLAPGFESAEPDVDLLFASSGIEEEVVRQAEHALLLDVYVPVAGLGHLIALKVLALDEERRPQDQRDLRSLLVEADETDLEQATQALQLIAKRGFNREKDLLKEFESVVRQLGPSQKP